ncbi:GTP cyclohydrolase I type 2 (plasmid) [Cupriavidus necator H850]|uniref:GTP cyclohydrolase, FolE2/MptA family n=1 Tax=Cupriavidus necator TaxID=106590 RepID=UPI00129EBD36|nr:GTP cyclohydrolase, FolE2/MptA family [Cupriavidus necator]KAI3599118.1 GTP cyclohydrolase I type 2 [Cupriavidus necator H850]
MVTLNAGKRLLPTIATLSMAVGLPATARGTHMSRFIEVLEAEKEALDQAGEVPKQFVRQGR